MNQKKIYHNIKDLFVYYLTINDQSKNQNLEKMFPFYVIKLSDKVTELFTLREIDENIDLFQEHLELCLQTTGDFEFLLQEKEINIILLFLESFYFAEEKLMTLEKENYALFLLEDEKKNKNLFETEEHKRKLKKNLN